MYPTSPAMPSEFSAHPPPIGVRRSTEIQYEPPVAKVGAAADQRIVRRSREAKRLSDPLDRIDCEAIADGLVERVSRAKCAEHERCLRMPRGCSREAE